MSVGMKVETWTVVYMTVAALNSVIMVFWKATGFSLWRATDSRCNKNVVSSVPCDGGEEPANQGFI